MEERLKKIFFAVLLVLVAVFSFLFAADRASSPESYAKTINVIDEKAETVLRLTASATLASAGISAIPGDTATPIAGKLADFSEYFLIILCVLYTEKYLMTIIGAALFKVLIPCACLLLIVALFRNGELLRRLALKLVIAGLAVFLIIPVSFKVSDMIYAAYSDSINGAISAAEQLSDETAELTDAGEDKGLIESVLNRLSETTATLIDKASDTVNRFVETLAVMIVTSCVIPILVLLFFLWLIKQLTGVDLGVPLPLRRGRRRAGKPEEEKSAE